MKVKNLLQVPNYNSERKLGKRIEKKKKRGEKKQPEVWEHYTEMEDISVFDVKHRQGNFFLLKAFNVVGLDSSF